jgi:hypothetical protein
MRNVLLPLAAAATVLLATPAGAATPRHRCHMRGHIIYASHEVRITSRANSNGGVDLAGCAYRTGHRTLLASTANYYTETEDVNFGQVEGVFVPVALSGGDQYASYTSLAVYDLATGYHYVVQSNNWPLGDPVPDGPELGAFRLNRHGKSVAMLETLTPNSSDEPEVSRIDVTAFHSDGNPIALDHGTGSEITVRSLRLHDEVASWRHGGVRRQARF